MQEFSGSFNFDISNINFWISNQPLKWCIKRIGFILYRNNPFPKIIYV